MNVNEQLLALCQAIRAVRMKLGHSQDSFAESIDMHRAYYSALERDEKNTTFKTLCRIANGLGELPSALLKLSGQ